MTTAGFLKVLSQRWGGRGGRRGGRYKWRNHDTGKESINEDKAHSEWGGKKKENRKTSKVTAVQQQPKD